MILKTVGRMIWVPIAFVLSALASAVVLVTLGMERVTQAWHGKGGDDVNIGAVFELMTQAHLLVSGLTLLPAVLLIIVGEVARIRASLYYIIGGGAALAAVPLLARLGQTAATGGLAMPPTIVWQVFATAGFLGGWLYWMLAGRNA